LNSFFASDDEKNTRKEIVKKRKKYFKTCNILKFYRLIELPMLTLKTKSEL